MQRLWYAAEDDHSPFARELVQLLERLGDKYEIDELAAKYTFTGRESMSPPQAVAIKEELENIDELLKQLEQARETAQIGIIDLEALSEFAEPGDSSSHPAAEKHSNPTASAARHEHAFRRWSLGADTVTYSSPGPWGSTP